MSGADFTPKKLPWLNLLRGFKQAVGHIIDQHWMEAGQVADLIERSIMEWANRIAGQLNTDLQAVSNELWNREWGVVAVAAVTSNETGIGTNLVDLAGLNATFTAVEGRVYSVEFELSTQVSADGSEARFSIYRVGSPSIEVLRRPTIPGAANRVAGVRGKMPRIECVPGGSAVTQCAPGQVTYDVRAQRGAGSGTIDMLASTAARAWIEVRDIGPVTPR